MSKRKEVASLAGVSEATVSRVLNGVGPVKEATRKRVVEAAQALNYQLNAVASSFARGRSGNLGVVLPRVPKIGLFSTHYFSEILNGIGDAVHEQGYGLLLLYRDPTEEYDYLSLFRTQRIDACVVLGASSLPYEQKGINRLSDERLPFCLVDQDDGTDRFSVVTANHEKGSYEAVRHLLAKNHRRIGFLNGSSQYSSSQMRLKGYQRALRENKLPVDRSLIYEGNYSRTSGYQAAEGIMPKLDQLDAMVVANDRMAIGLIQGLRDQGAVLPNDLPIVGYDDSDMARMLDIPLTTVRVPFYQMGYLSAKQLLDRLPAWQDGNPIFKETLKTKLIIRKSCSIQPVS